MTSIRLLFHCKQGARALPGDWDADYFEGRLCKQGDLLPQHAKVAAEPQSIGAKPWMPQHQQQDGMHWPCMFCHFVVFKVYTGNCNVCYAPSDLMTEVCDPGLATGLQGELMQESGTDY